MPEKLLNRNEELYEMAHWEHLVKIFEQKKPKLNLDFIYTSSK